MTHEQFTPDQVSGIYDFLSKTRFREAITDAVAAAIAELEVEDAELQRLARESSVSAAHADQSAARFRDIADQWLEAVEAQLEAAGDKGKLHVSDLPTIIRAANAFQLPDDVYIGPDVNGHPGAWINGRFLNVPNLAFLLASHVATSPSERNMRHLQTTIDPQTGYVTVTSPVAGDEDKLMLIEAQPFPDEDEDDEDGE